MRYRFLEKVSQFLERILALLIGIGDKKFLGVFLLRQKSRYCDVSAVCAIAVKSCFSPLLEVLGRWQQGYIAVFQLVKMGNTERIGVAESDDNRVRIGNGCV